ncbi:AmmeMemoRadiSam system protein B [Candidatus Woesearchaeota archaeon]|nr:AmmeMemoRadiSam system protein B [Candidatus Woesearchaeota archaeon]
MREPVVAGRFYSKNKDELVLQIKKCINSDFSVTDQQINGKIIGAISPHAGYMASGPGAALVYNTIKKNRNVKTFIVLAPNHTGRGRTSLIKDSYLTPLGECKVDLKVADEIINNTPIVEDSVAHILEHSLEVQLPFIQYFFPEAKIVPIIISSMRNMAEISESFSKVLDWDTDCVVASSDFTHYGYGYGYSPFEDDFRRRIEEIDMDAIAYIKKGDTEGFLDFITENRMTICGYLPIYLMLKSINKYKTTLLNYYTSSDILGGPEDSSVSYASLVFEQVQPQ